MNHYRLLRDNKESGPYTQEEIIAKGFKPYDLIWVEGKSAGWRYPSEISELKSFAPIIEEQPYDRFYKKPTQQKHSRFEDRTSVTPVSVTSILKDDWKEREEKPALKPATYSIMPVTARHIHVTLPSGNSVSLTKTIKKETNEEKPLYQSLITTEDKKTSFTENITAPYKTISTQNILSGIKEPLKNQKPAAIVAENIDNNTTAKFQHPAYPVASLAGYEWTTLLGLFVGIATLVGLGIMIGLSISRSNNEAILAAALAKKNMPALKQPATNSSQIPVIKEDKPTDDLSTANSTKQPATDENKALIRNAVIKSNSPSATAEGQEPENNKRENIPGNNGSDNPSKDALKKPVITPSFELLSSQLNLTTHGFKVGAFGGISELQCTLVNDSKFTLDMVEVSVQYIQSNEKVYKTEILSFNNIAAGTQVTLMAPKSSRGIKVTGKITKINSKEFGLLNTTVKS